MKADIHDLRIKSSLKIWELATQPLSGLIKEKSCLWRCHYLSFKYHIRTPNLTCVSVNLRNNQAEVNVNQEESGS